MFYMPSAIQNEKRRFEEALGQFVLFPGIPIKNFENELIDSCDLIKASNASNERQVLEFAMHQLKAIYDQAEKQENEDSRYKAVKAVVGNNLGCTYVSLGRYTEAKDLLSETENLAEEGSIAKRAAQFNLNLLAKISSR